ncbi:MAG: amidase, partial [Propionibacteriaceae bacterium]|nr:amidase [Propionibacteriaceae bacterium]
MDLHELSAIETAAAIRDRVASVREITEHALERAASIGPTVGAFAYVAVDRALAQADAIDAALASGTAPDGSSAPLLGVPCPIKDLDPVAGLPFEEGSATRRGKIAKADTDIVGWLKDAGTIMLGKTNTPEFGLPCYTEPDVAPAARTPWDITRSAGGSSGGAAAAVSSGIVPIAHGSDGGGSIRIPASVCGLVGLKASRGRISPGATEMPGPGLVTDGVLTRTVRDTALALDILGKPRVGDIYFAPQPAAAFLAACDLELSGLRVGVLTTPVITPASVHPAALAAVDKAASLLEGFGNHIESAPVPFSWERWGAFAALWAIGAQSLEIEPEKEHLLRPLTRWLREQGSGISGLEFAQALAAAQQIAHDTQVAWADFDVILTPTLAQPP